MSIRIDGKNALVTGGTRGLGRAIALALAQAGASVVTCYRADAEAAAQLARDLKETGREHHVLQADVSRPADVAALLAECRQRLGTLHVLVNNAGTISHVPFAQLTLAEWHRVIDTNLTAAAQVIQRALPLLADGGSIINVGSRVATVGLPLRAHYTAAKAGLTGLSRSLGKELGGRGIRVNVLAPGVIETEEARLLPRQRREHYTRLAALGRLGRPEEVAAAALFLASDASSYITGETLHVDGGV
jgi:3-oxoacyl-[acyl-carrier protein] reductase